MGKIEFQFNCEKAIQAVLWLVQRNNGAMDKLQLVKMIFLADREHLAKYGRPIVGGNYFAMKYGPVSSELLDCLDAAETVGSAFKVDNGHKVIAKKAVGQDWLSQSDLDILDSIYQTYGHLDQWKLSDITHDFIAYKKNAPPENSRSPLPYEDFFLDYDEETKKMLQLIADEQEAWAEIN
jgi:uncharacterized phage-associated protein